MNRKKYEKVFRTLFLLYLTVILILATIKRPDVITTGFDKFEHIAAFIVFTFLMYFSFNKVNYITIFLTGLGYGILIEIIQHFLPYRVADVMDIIANIIGLLTGLLMIKIIRSKITVF
jgi:VanZ family protein